MKLQSNFPSLRSLAGRGVSGEGLPRTVLFVLVATLLSSCASVPRDAGLSDVERAVAERAGVRLTAERDDARTRALLADGLTADEAVEIAVANNPRSQLALAELGIARADLIEASTIANPIFEFEIRFPGEPYHPYEFRLAQALIDLAQLPRRRALGRAAFDAAKLRASSGILRFAAGVRSTYYDLLAATQHVAMSRTGFESAKAAAEVALKQHAAGNITDLDLENEQAMYEQAKLDLARAEKELLLAREALTRALGIREWSVAETFPDLPSSELDPQQLEQLAAKQRLDIALAEREVEIAERRIPLARLEALRETEVDVHWEREPDGAKTVGPGIELPIPIFNTGRAARTRAEAEYLRARATRDALLAESSSMLRAAHASLAEARARVEYYRDIVIPRRRRIVELTKLEHNAMLAGVFQLLQAKTNEANALRDFIDAQRDYWAARTDLDRAVQGISEEIEFRDQRGTRNAERGTVRGGH